MVVYPCLVSAASTVPQTPNRPASALLDTQGTGPIAQVCPAEIKGTKLSEERSLKCFSSQLCTMNSAMLC